MSPSPLAMAFRLRDNLHWCVCAGVPVFLDLEADRYFCLSPETGAAFLRLASNAAASRDTERLAALIARGLLIADPGASALRQPCRPMPPTAEFLDGEWPPAGPLAVTRALAAEARANFRLRTQGLRKLLEQLGEAPKLARHSDCPERDLMRIAAASRSASLIARAADRCLIRAIAVHWRCRQITGRVELIFGVRLHPFGAHCWVQVDGRVIVGGFEKAGLYTPILAAV